MPTKRDYYEILGVDRGASQDELKTAFRNLARKFHPDVNSDPAAEQNFKEINEAYGILSDPDKRAAYDRYGHAGVDNMNGMPDFSNFDMFSDLFEGLFGFGMGGGGRRRNAPRRGADLSYTVQMEFDEVVRGAEKEIEITRDEDCANCKGTGAEPGTSRTKCETCGGRGEVRQVRQTFLGSMVQVTTCPACNGAGEVIGSPCKTCRGRGLERKTLRKVVSIPAGVDNGTQIRLGGEGQPGINGGPKGNLYLEVRVKAHKFFKRRNDDVLVDVNINVAQAALGEEVEVPTVEGSTKLHIPSGTQPGKVFTMKGKGIPHVRGGGRGDQHVIVNVEIPTKLNRDQKELLEQLGKTLVTEVKPQERGFFETIKDVLGG